MKKRLKLFFSVVGIIVLLFFIWLFVGKAPQKEEITWGISFSQKQAELLGVSWKDNYLAILDDLEVPALKIIAYWDLLEPSDNNYYFDDLDFQVKEAEKRNVRVVFSLGRKVPRWPECHIPQWANDLEIDEQEEKLLDFIKKLVLRYRDYDIIWAWQVENEPFFNFGECPEIKEDFLKKEISLVKSLDNKERTIIISDSGSNRFWFKTAKLGDMVSISLYRKVWFHEFDSYVKYPFPPVFYWRKAQIVRLLFGDEVICGELQAEPWGPALINNISLKEQKKTMNLELFRENIQFAKETGLGHFYFWGAEWWYWLKKEKDMPEIWQEAKTLFQG